ncbi:efflux RND transporter periplasmic adaptor subunit [Schlesneria sp. T3-172]|uniref:efflux RND transporter periplasmic adaptor subunit n=1 Tax=Schlesneria sphaerica TaxID=3373610 RepID=UPI0037C593AE
MSMFIGRGVLRAWSGGALLITLVMSGCSSKIDTAPPAIVKVVSTRPLPMQIIEWDEYVGRIDPIEEVEVRARVGGHLESTHFKEGQIVQKGDLLFVLDQRPYQIVVEQAAADLAGAEARVEEAQAQLKQAEADLAAVESQRDLAASMLERSKRLIAKNASTQEELDTRESNLKQTIAALEVRVARIALAKSAIVTALSETNAARSRLKSAKLNLEYTEVKAPVTGRVSNRVVTDGNLISGGTDQSSLLTTIVSLDPIHCYFDADEQSFLKYVRLVEAGKLSDLRSMQVPVLVALADEPGQYLHQGHLDFLDNRLDRRTATMRGRAVLKNPDLILTPGLFAKVRVPGSGKYEAVLVPDTAIGTDQAEKFVFVVDATKTIQRQKVVIGPKIHGLRVVRDGLKGGEQIVLRGLQRVRAGTIVEADFEQTVALDDGLPDEAPPIPEQDRIPSYVSGESTRSREFASSAH